MPGMSAATPIPRRATGVALIDRTSSAALGRMVRALPILWCLAASPFFLAGTLDIGPVMSWASLAILPLYFVARRQFDALGLMAALGFFLVAYVPAFSIALIGDPRPTAIAIIILPWLALLEFGTRKLARPVRSFPAQASRFDLLAIAAYLGVAILWGLTAEEPTNASMQFLVPYAFGLWHLERLARAGRWRLLGLALYGVAILFYSLVIWDTFGRLLLGALAVTPLLIVFMHQRWTPGPLLLGLILPPMIGLTQWVRSSDITLMGIQSSSMSSPSLLAVGLMERLDLLAVRWSGFWDQLGFFYFSWVPRSIWPEKPLGLGLTIVDELTGRQGVSDSHSLAPGVVGEALWLFGPHVLIGLVIALMLYWSVSLVIRLLARNQAAALAIHFALLPTLIWGGTASYSARVWALLLPFIIYAWAATLVERRRGRRR